MKLRKAMKAVAAQFPDQQSITSVALLRQHGLFENVRLGSKFKEDSAAINKLVLNRL